jgi:Mg/Co/Ni transporter MgtE
VGQLAIIEIVKDPYKDDFDDLIADLSDNIKERFLTSLNNDEINTVIDLGYLSVS